MRIPGANYDLGEKLGGAHQSGLNVEQKILGEKDRRYQPNMVVDPKTQNQTISFVYTSVQFDITFKSSGNPEVKKVTPPTVKRPKN